MGDPFVPTIGELEAGLRQRLGREFPVSAGDRAIPTPKAHHARRFFEIAADAGVDPLEIRDAVAEILEARGPGMLLDLDIHVTILPHPDGPSLPSRIVGFHRG